MTAYREGKVSFREGYVPWQIKNGPVNDHTLTNIQAGPLGLTFFKKKNPWKYNVGWVWNWRLGINGEEDEYDQITIHETLP